MKQSREKGGDAMRIRNTFIGNGLEVTGQAPLAKTPVQSRDLEAASDDHVAAPEVERVTELARQEPEVRQERVDDAASRVAGGEYFTRDAALRTADALLTAPE
jgi:hypothetical protein